MEQDEGSENIDLSYANTQGCLKKVGLFEFANLPWLSWEFNSNAQVQADLLRQSEGCIAP